MDVNINWLTPVSKEYTRHFGQDIVTLSSLITASLIAVTLWMAVPIKRIMGRAEFRG
jgi:hypothetical protein